MLPLYAHSKLSSIGLSIENLFDSNAARFSQSVVIVIFDLFIWIWLDLYGNDGFAIHPHVFCSNGSTTPRFDWVEVSTLELRVHRAIFPNFLGWVFPKGSYSFEGHRRFRDCNRASR